MSDNRRTTSIARHINRGFFLRIFWTILLVNVLAVTLIIAGWCYTAEYAALGKAWTPGIRRHATWDQSVSFPDKLLSAVYRFEAEGVAYEKEMAPLFDAGMRFLPAALGVELIVLVATYRTGKNRTRQLLKPLHRMAETAQALTDPLFLERKYHSLEDAIARISPDSPDARLSTGDRDLVGLEEAINSLMARMREAYHEQARFVSDASHELRTPIAVIQGYAGMLTRWGKDDAKILEESISAIKTESEHMQKLVEQLLFLARGDVGRQQLTFAPVDLSELMRDVHEEYEMIDKQHVWRLQADNSVPAFGDAAMLKQAARILVDNAARYSSPGDPVTLRSYVTHDGTPCFSVQDNGTGIAQSDIPRIFERFYRADPARARHTGGTGLGLSIAKWIVDRHNGYFDVVSRVGVGTRIVVCLPVKDMRDHKTSPAAEMLRDEPVKDATPA